MELFHPVSENNILETIPYFANAGGRICDDTAGVTYQWRKLFQTDICLYEGCLITRSVFPQVGSCYSFPVGNGNPEKVYPLLREDAKALGVPFRFACITEDRLASLENSFHGAITAEEKRNWADYLYEPAAFAYTGKRFHTQKNHINRFYADNPEAELVPVTDNNAAEVETFFDRVLALHPQMPDWEKGEVEGTRDLFRMRDALHQIGACLKTDKGIAAFAMGEVRGDTLHIHAEKADTTFSGAYPAMAQAFARYAAGNVKYINREDDAGDAGIRYSKEQYRPICLIPKYLVTVRE